MEAYRALHSELVPVRADRPVVVQINLASAVNEYKSKAIIILLLSAEKA